MTEENQAFSSGIAAIVAQFFPTFMHELDNSKPFELYCFFANYGVSCTVILIFLLRFYSERALSNHIILFILQALFLMDPEMSMRPLCVSLT